MKTGIELITEERHHQKYVWSAEHDDAHSDGSLAFNAAILAVEHLGVEVNDISEKGIRWFELELKKKRTSIECLTVAGALIAAEIDRLNRLSSKEVA